MRRFGRAVTDCKGSTALEFALVAPVFVLLLMGVIEIAIFCFKTVVLEGAVRDAARLVRTGQAQQGADPIGAFKSQLCTSLAGTIDCAKLAFYVRSGPNFSGLSFNGVLDAQGGAINQGFVPGLGNDAVLVRVGYTFTFVTPILAQSFNGSGWNQVNANALFRNEPFK